MFQTITWVSLSLVLTGIVVHWLVSPHPRLAKDGTENERGRFRWCFCCDDRVGLAMLKRFGCALALASLLLLFVSGFAGRLLFGEQIHGYTLMLHVGLAPVFVICVGFVVITWGQQCLLNKNDRERLTSLFCLKKQEVAGTSDLGWKLTFWLAAFLAVPVSLSIVLGMFPIFGTHGQEMLHCLHQYTALALTLTVLIHLHLLIRRKVLYP